MKSTSASQLIIFGVFLSTSPLFAEEKVSEKSHPKVVTFGEMHLAIGQKQHQGRVLLREVVERNHFYGVGALAGLNGEITIRDGKIVISSVSAGKPKLIDADMGKPQATLLVGAYVSEWSQHKVVKNIPGADFDEFVRETAARTGLDTTRPFVFRIDGEFQDVRLHIINGACPIHARIHKQELPVDRQPYEAEFARVRGTVIGIYAKDAVGKLTHPSTSAHAHLIFKDDVSGAELTGHLEQVGIRTDAVLNLPKR
ncbi:MAG: acetolactate decarboxylase [Planctomycetaceae bacterium]|nr:acetolactate decarboxylase [Planctomycetaceae bacterium]